MNWIKQYLKDFGENTDYCVATRGKFFLPGLHHLLHFRLHVSSPHVYWESLFVRHL